MDGMSSIDIVLSIVLDFYQRKSYFGIIIFIVSLPSRPSILIKNWMVDYKIFTAEKPDRMITKFSNYNSKDNILRTKNKNVYCRTVGQWQEVKTVAVEH